MTLAKPMTIVGNEKGALSVLMTIISMLGALLVYGAVTMSGPAAATEFLVLSGDLLSVYGAKVFLAYTAEGATPIVRDVFKCCSRLNAVLRIAYGWVIDPSAYITYILFHSFFLSFLVNLLS